MIARRAQTASPPTNKEAHLHAPGQDHSLDAIGINPEQALSDLGALKEMIHYWQPLRTRHWLVDQSALPLNVRLQTRSICS